ncbi:MAG: ATP-binding protein [Candidatus Auribacterota bacterium]|jgi:MinD superfamily P-loop ATPase|nr:ATP-binding protein [Candidatus Auribacterota bacterium]
MRICMASGKGGTGKTTVAVNLALVAGKVQYVDCDVEEPNGHLFLKPKIDSSYDIGIAVPVLDDELCNKCGICSKVCEFNAIAVFAKSVLIYPELCHGCGACIHLCPRRALRESTRCIGVVERGHIGDIAFLHGILKIGEPLAPPLIRALKKDFSEKIPVIIDAPPGTSCPVVATMRNSDYVVLVTEPTPFGLNDLKLAVALTEELSLPAGVVINKTRNGDNDSIEQFCEEKNLPVLIKLPFDRAIATLYSQGKNFIENPKYAQLFKELFKKIRKEYDETACNHKR